MNILYLRSDFWFGLKAGGSVAHVAGVIGAMSALGHSVHVLSTDTLHGVGPDVATVDVVRPWALLRVPKVRRLGPLAYGYQLSRGLRRRPAGERPDIVYHRHGDFSAAGALVAQKLGRPLVLEVNALVVRWAGEQGAVEISRLAWLARRIERHVFDRTTLFVAISDVVRDHLLEEGVPPARVIVSPNGVDPHTFHPDVDPGNLRERLGIRDKTVVGFIGTFGSWHGVDVLAEAVTRVVAAHRDVHFLMIGDGPQRPRVEEIVDRAGVRRHVTFTGTVPAEQAPAHLAACDIFVSPHGRPRNGRFIGSPTKLFEYMAMGRGIVASRLDQIGEVLEHGRTAVLVAPGDAEQLAAGILQLTNDSALARRLGENARQVVLERYTWKHNVERVLSALGALTAPCSSSR